MKLDHPSVRLVPEMQALLEQAGGTSAAIRALMIIGAAQAGYDLAPLRREIGLLLLDESVDSAVLAALSASSQTSGRQTAYNVPAYAPPRSHAGPPIEQDDDPLASLGEEV